MSAFDQYLLDIGHDELLEADDEVRLAQAIERGRDTDDRRARVAADAARRELVERNLRLVISIARRYRVPGCDLQDLVQEGNIGLMRAVERFDWRLGYRFSTLATWYVRQAVLRAVEVQGRTVRLPARRLAEVRALVRAEQEAAATLHHQPSRAELADALGISPADVERRETWAATVVSLETPVGEGDVELGDLFVATEDGDGSPEAAVVAASTRREIDRLLASLPAREAEVLRLRYGIDGDEPLTLDVVADALGVTRERVRQIELRALSRLRRDDTVVNVA